MAALVVSKIVQLYDHSVWTLRNIVRGIEKVGPPSPSV